MVMMEGHSARSVAQDLGIKRSTLQRYVEKAKNGTIERYSPNYAVRKVLSDEQEKELEAYLISASNMCFGFSPTSVKRIVYEYAVANDIDTPEPWSANKSAGKDWFSGYLKRHPNLSLRRPEATSLSRATSFNRHNVQQFFTNLEALLKKRKFLPQDIYNTDETGCSTVQSMSKVKVVAPKKEKQVGKVTSGERDTLVTMVGTVSASGSTVPPMFIFPRVNFRENMLKGAPPGSIGVAHVSGWMTSDNFLVYMKHFVKSTRSSKDHPVLLLLDNVDSHISVDVINYAKENGVNMLTFPPHCSHKMQILDRTVHGPFKHFYGEAANGFMVSNPGKTITIHDICEIVGTAYPMAFTPSNIQSGFKATGVYPFNRNIFTDQDFSSSSVTDRDPPPPGPSGMEREADPGTSDGETNPPTSDGRTSGDTFEPKHHPASQQLRAESSRTATGSRQQPKSANRISPASEVGPPLPAKAPGVEKPLHPANKKQGISESSFVDLSPLPKAAPRKTKGGRKKGSTLVLTDTPVKARIEEEKKEAEERKRKPKAKASKRKSAEPESKSAQTLVKKKLVELDDLGGEYDEASPKLPTMKLQTSGIKEEDFVLVKFRTEKNRNVLYIGQVQDIGVNNDEWEYEITFMRRVSRQSFKFKFPLATDVCDVDHADVVTKLPDPIEQGGRYLTFPVDLKPYDDELC